MGPGSVTLAMKKAIFAGKPTEKKQDDFGEKSLRMPGSGNHMESLLFLYMIYLDTQPYLRHPVIFSMIEMFNHLQNA